MEIFGKPWMTWSRWSFDMESPNNLLLRFLDWEEAVFQAAGKFLTKLRPSARALIPPHAAVLEPRRRRLGALASLIAQEPLSVGPHEVRGARGRDLLLPSAESALSDPAQNDDLLLLTVVVLAALRRTRAQTWADYAAALGGLRAELPEFEVRYRAAISEVIHQDQLFDPAFGRWQKKLLRGESIAGAPPIQEPIRWPPLLGGCFPALLDDKNGADVAEPGARGTVHRAAKDPTTVTRTTLPARPENYNPILHTFEKAETLDTYDGRPKNLDGSDELDDHQKALEEIDFKQVIRGGPPAASVLQMDVQLEGEIPDIEQTPPPQTAVLYPEWDYRTKRYRPNWCAVYPTKVHQTRPGYARDVLKQYQGQIDKLVRRLRVHRDGVQEERRQLDGDDIDIDAAIDALCQFRSGHDGTDKIYLRRPKKHRDVATAVLVDISLSTDAWVQNRRVIDVAKQALVVLGEVAYQLNDTLAVYAFASKTRNLCRVFEVADYDTPWSLARARIGALEPQGYTRMGPAIRHVSAILGRRPNRKKLLIVITDGKPSDYDRYEGRYGVADIRKSLLDAAEHPIVAHALTIDKTARSYLSATFGLGAWHILSDPARLPRVLTEVYGRLAR